MFEGVGTKLGDLGRACYDGHNGPSYYYQIPGDCSYAPPELLYGQVATGWEQRRFGCDLYLLGSMVVFFFTCVGMTSLLLDQLDDSQHWEKWGGTFEEILPHIRDAFNKAVELFLSGIPSEIQSDMSAIVRYLCEPDPKLRGHPLNRRNPLGNQCSLERFVSALDILAKKAELKILRSHRAQNVQPR